MMLTTLAIRNIWRNKRRTLITMAAVAFAVFLSSVLRSFQKGAWDNVIETSVNLFYGYAQIQGSGYWDDKTLDNSMLADDMLMGLSTAIKGIESVAPRLESFALASSGDLTQGVALVGVDPELEMQLTGLNSKVIEGRYLRGDEQGALLASGVADKLNLSVGDTLVLISQGYHGANAAGKYHITGIFRYALPDLNKTLVYLPLKTTQHFYAADERVTSIACKIDGQRNVPGVVKALKQRLDPELYEVMDYKELLPELMQARQLDEGGSYLILGILYALIGFAIFGTILMMTQERSYEYGVLTAIGMGRWSLFAVTITETIAVGLLGALLGILLSIPVVYYLHINPVDLSYMGENAAEAFEKFGMEPIVPTAFSARVFFNQALIIFIITVLIGIFPLYKILTLKPVKAMRN
jgi:putative ABC transport system permease protein